MKQELSALELHAKNRMHIFRFASEVETNIELQAIHDGLLYLSVANGHGKML